MASPKFVRDREIAANEDIAGNVPNESPLRHHSRPAARLVVRPVAVLAKLHTARKLHGVAETRSSAPREFVRVSSDSLSDLYDEVMETASVAAPEEQPSQVPPGEPPVIRRLPRGVDYTDIKMIIMSLPSPLTTLVWMGNLAADPIWAAFNGKTLRAIDRRLRRREEALAAQGQSAPENERTLVGGLRHHWVLLCMHETNERAPRKRTKWIIVRLIDPARLRPEFQPLGPLEQRIDVEVWKTSRKGPTLFD